ncbi:MAG: hypothetical protein AAF847_05525 [Bacteroidota bacterium]
MWKYTSQQIDAKTIKYRIQVTNDVLSFRSFAQSLQQIPKFRQFFNELLQNSAYEGFFWETPAITLPQLDSNFEFVLVQSSHLPRIKANPSAFQKHLEGAGKIRVFSNLRGDAQLIVPKKMGENSCYAHLASFVRHAPDSQVDEFWKQVGITYEDHIGGQPIWLSTHGLGVPWLHLRIDTYPKYYHHKPYKKA